MTRLAFDGLPMWVAYLPEPKLVWPHGWSFGVAEVERIRALLDERSMPEPNSGCLLWLGYGRDKGYGRFKIADHNISAHRAAFALRHGSIPAGLSVCHECDVPWCINQDHLFLGTNKDNIADRQQKGRTVGPRHVGEDRPQSRLTDDRVREILTSLEDSASLARRFDVSRTTVSNVRLGKTWRHLAREFA